MTNDNMTRLRHGFLWGGIATLAMSVPMVLGMATGVAPMPKPIPVAIIGTLFGDGIPKPLLMLLAVATHISYGAFWGAVLARITPNVTVWKGVGLGIFLWLIMQLAVLPFLGWGVFGMAVTPMIAVATLILHLIYGGVAGWLIDR